MNEHEGQTCGTHLGRCAVPARSKAQHDPRATTLDHLRTVQGIVGMWRGGYRRDHGLLYLGQSNRQVG